MLSNMFKKVVTIVLVLTAVASSKASIGSTLAMMGTYSIAATETYLQFDGRVGLRSSSQPSHDEAVQQVRKQIKFIQSNFRRHKMAAIRSDWQVQITQIEQAAPGLYRVYYHFTSTALILNTLNGAIEIMLPVNPDTVENDQRVATCMDPHEHQGAGFWYYWNPALPGCDMTLNSDYLSFTGTFTRTPNTVQTYPEYNRLFVNGVAKIVVLMGKVNPTDRNDPAVSNPWSYPAIKSSLLAAGFSNRVFTVDEVRKTLPTVAGDEPFLEEYNLSTPRGVISVTLFFGETAIVEAGSSAFHAMYKSAIENASVIMYGGHAGTGKNLDLGMIRKASGQSITARKDMYQILMLSACFPYAYYTRDYFAFKASASDPKGTKNLDILAEGIEGGFDHSGPQVVAVIKAIENFATGKKLTSYQEMITSDPAFSSSLFSVLGDEDNSQPQF